MITIKFFFCFGPFFGRFVQNIYLAFWCYLINLPVVYSQRLEDNGFFLSHFIIFIILIISETTFDYIRNRKSKIDIFAVTTSVKSNKLCFWKKHKSSSDKETEFSILYSTWKFKRWCFSFFQEIPWLTSSALFEFLKKMLTL